MKSLIISVIALLISSTFVFAQDSDDKILITNNYCGPFNKVLETPKKYKEGMLFSADGGVFESRTGQYFKGGVFFFVNQDTGTWSLINIFGDGTACMMQSGTKFSPYLGNDPWDVVPPKGEKG